MSVNPDAGRLPSQEPRAKSSTGQGAGGSVLFGYKFSKINASTVMLLLLLLLLLLLWHLVGARVVGLRVEG